MRESEWSMLAAHCEFAERLEGAEDIRFGAINLSIKTFQAYQPITTPNGSMGVIKVATD